MHRLLGRMYLIAILIGTVSATYLSWTSGYKNKFCMGLWFTGISRCLDYKCIDGLPGSNEKTDDPAQRMDDQKLCGNAGLFLFPHTQ